MNTANDMVTKHDYEIAGKVINQTIAKLQRALSYGEDMRGSRIAAMESAKAWLAANIKDMEENQNQSDTIDRKDVKIGVMLPKIKTMMTGVLTIHISLAGIAELVYTDGSKESAKLSDETMIQVLDWQKYHSGRTKKEADIDVLNIISQVQSQRIKS